MAHAEKRAGKLTGYWYGEVDLRHKGGQRFRVRFDTRKDAEGYEAYVKATGEEPPTARRSTGRTFREVAELCKQAGGPRKGRWKHGRDPSVLQRLEHVCGLLGDLDIAQVGTVELDRVVKDLEKRPGKAKGSKRLGAGTINRYLTAASAVLTFACERGMMTGHPVVPWQEEHGGREDTLEVAQEAAVLAHMKARGHNVEALCVRVLAETGLRLGELMKLAPEQVTNEWIRLRADQTKTKAAREVYIDPALARDLRAVLASGGLPKAYLLRRKFKAACKACGYSVGLVLHSLRHTRATRLLQAGVDPQVTMEMMGWTSFSTMKRYRHVNSTMHVEAAKKVSHLRGETVENATVVAFEPQRKVS